MTVARTPVTKLFDREYRFLIDDPESPQKLAYQLTKPLKLNNVFGNNGVYKFVLGETGSTIYDDMVNGITDYYKYHPDELPDGSELLPDPSALNRKGWL